MGGGSVRIPSDTQPTPVMGHQFIWAKEPLIRSMLEYWSQRRASIPAPGTLNKPDLPCWYFINKDATLALCLQHSFKQPLNMRLLALCLLAWAPFLTLIPHFALRKGNLAWPAALPWPWCLFQDIILEFVSQLLIPHHSDEGPSFHTPT